MLSFLQQPYVFSIVVAVATAVLLYAYQYTVDKDPERTKKVFYKTLVAGVVAAVGLTWAIYRPTPIATEPFSADGIAGGPALPATAT